ncbi:flavodoxin [Clostridium homopropionicum DSM 5847]|uniref:Flavodoxin n=1 Tax=Clostridium homopropionicum DSM 5847 TaxID=1121318 RepID=A0A0L6ZAH4_9CLOT|nr:flavodoxin family protein [Clostridium homopropionicum]KOA19967.1 flavodoxin [Clostridium homopropionicum DSM 5847]SFG63523.1 Flavodoxin [Clostridium homopropionicum]
MKTLIIYASVHHGNTEKIGKTMAEILNADIVKFNEINVDTLKDYDLIGFGSGIFYGKFHKGIIELIENIPALSNKKAFIFSTSGQGKEDYNNSIKDKLEEKGFKVLGHFACKGFDTFGPFKLIGGIAKGRPNEDDFQKAKDFAKAMIVG